MNRRSVKILMVLVVAVALILGGIALAVREPEPIAPVQGTPAESTSAPPAETQPNGVKTLRCVSVGDNLIHDGIYEQANKRTGGKGYDFSFCYARIKPVISSFDLATINQETIIAKSYEPAGYPRFNSPQELGKAVEDAGFDVVNLANNHMVDKGEKGLREAIDFWDSTALVRTGAYRNEAELQDVQFVEKNGIKIGLVGVTQYTNGLSLPKGSELRYISTTDLATIERKIKAAKATCDAVMVQVHWGVEYNTKHSQDQKNLARKMADWGADLIIGHHPHVLQPMEWLDRADGGRSLVVYSLGNFISMQHTPARVIGGMVQYTIQKEPGKGGVTVTDVHFEPLITQYVRGSHDVQIYPFADYTDKLAKQQASRIKEPNFSRQYITEFVEKIIPQEFL